jgi:hypothetical protein
MAQNWRVRSATNEVQIEAEAWLDALALGLPQLGVAQGALARLSCEELPNGGAVARDPRTGDVVRVDPIDDALVPPPAEPTWEEEPPVPAQVLSDDIIEDLYFRLGDISSATGVASASAVALRIALELVPAGAGATLIRTRAGNSLRFRAVSGPAGPQLIDTTIPLDRGVAGYVCQLGVGIAIADVRRDSRHDARIDRSTGFQTRAMLAVPVRPDTGGVFGVMELLNPPTPFTDQQLEICARVAASLGTFLNGAYEVR